MALTVLKGGLDGQPKEEELKPFTFVAAWITDTRLMGVNAMRIDWKDRMDNDVHQFFYFDAVDTGFERFQEITGNDEKELHDAEVSFAGGLGGRKIGITEEEALFLIQDFHKVNRHTGQPAPRIGIRLKRMLTEPVKLDDEAEKILISKICKAPLSPNETINYFMMRVADKDDTGMKFLSGGKLGGKDSPVSGKLFTLYRNKISFADKNHATCESLLGSDSGYEMWMSELTLSNNLVSTFRRKSRMAISDTEAFMTLSHSEFVMVYEFAEEGLTIDQDTTPFTRRSSFVEELDGSSYMLFRPNNNHVDTKDYRLYDDIFGVYHLTSTGQLVCSSNSQRDMAMLELDLVFSPVYKSLSLIGNYEFNEPVMAQFLASGYDDFNEFVREITNLPDGE